MKAQIAYLRYKIDSSFWFVPGLMIVAAIALSFGMVEFDRFLEGRSINLSEWLYNATPDGARQLLMTIASSIITVTSLVFSMTLVALTLASQQLGPRLLENFMRNRANQVVLGFFVATFVYALLILRTISEVDQAHFVPETAIATAIVMSIASFAILIFFIHHVAESIQADAVIASVSANLDRLIKMNFVEHDGKESADEAAVSDSWPSDFDKRAVPLCGDTSGYIQTLDLDTLRSLAIEHNVRIHLDCRPGHFVVEGCPLAFIAADGDLSEDVRERILATFVFGPKRTPAQDVEYEIRVLAEIAMRALSPGINDHYTAITCVDRLTAALAPILRLRIPGGDIFDDDGSVILRTIPPGFRGMLDAAFNDIRQSAAKNTAVTIRLLESLSLLAQQCTSADHRKAVGRHVEMVARSAEEFIFEPNDKADVEARLRVARRHVSDARGDG